MGTTSSEHGSVGSDETQRTSFTDEAQTCYNILIILRTDTQHLISLRNENLPALEDKSVLLEDDASSRTALLACINESITAATQSITQLGPFLDRHRWPAAVRPTTPESHRRSFIVALKPRRRRQSKNSSGPLVGPCATKDGESLSSLSSPEELFSWTLALTAQHTAVLVATQRLATFLESGIANVSEEERRRRDARASWWEQGRGEFENVGLIQSLLSRPKRTFGDTLAEETATVTVDVALAKLLGDDGDDGDETAQNLTPIMEHDDGRSEALLSEAFTPSTLALTPKQGLTARPRRSPSGSFQQDEDFCVRRVSAEPPLVHSLPGAESSSHDVRLSRTETFGAEKSDSPLSRLSVSRQLSRIATLSLLPSVLPLQTALSGQPDSAREQGTEHSAPMEGLPLSEGYFLAAGSATQHLSYTQHPTPPFTPNASPEKHNAAQAPLVPQVQQELSPLQSPSAETVYTPYTPGTPLGPSNTSFFTQRAALSQSLPGSETFQPMTQGRDRVVISSPDQGAENFALRVSPVEAKSRVSIAPVIEGPDNIILVSPLESEPGTLTRPLLGISPITASETHDRTSQGDADGHMAWLGYVNRKQEVCASRWSLRRAHTSEI